MRHIEVTASKKFCNPVWQMPGALWRILLSRNDSLWLLALPWVILPFPWKMVQVCSSIVSLACFLPVELLESKGLFSSCTVSVPFSPSWQCFCQHNSLKNLMGVLWVLGSSALDKSHSHKSLWDKLFSTLGLHWDCCCVTPLSFLEVPLFDWTVLWGIFLDISEVLTKDFTIKISASSLDHVLLRMPCIWSLPGSHLSILTSVIIWKVGNFQTQ